MLVYVFFLFVATGEDLCILGVVKVHPPHSYAIFLCYLGSDRKLSRPNHLQTGGAGVSKDALRNKRRVVKLVTIVTVMFALSWLPIQVLILICYLCLTISQICHFLHIHFFGKAGRVRHCAIHSRASAGARAREPRPGERRGAEGAKRKREGTLAQRGRRREPPG